MCLSSKLSFSMYLVYFNVIWIRFACHFRNIIVQRLRATCRISALYKCMNYYCYYMLLNAAMTKEWMAKWLSIAQARGLQTTAREPNPASKTVSSGPQRHFVNIEKITYSQTFIDLVECNVSRNIHIMWDVRPSDYCVIAGVALVHKSLDSPGVTCFRNCTKSWRIKLLS